MKLTPRGMYAIAVEEGIVPARYIDLSGTVTWGLGHTMGAGEPSPFDKPLAMPTGGALTRAIADAIRVFEETVPEYAEAVIDAFGLYLKPHELDGLTGWHYNTGGAYKTSAAKLWQRGDKAGAVRILQSWNKVTVTDKGKKRVSPTLAARRAAEARIILDGVYPPLTTLPVWGTDGAGRVRWNAPVRTLTYDQFCRHLSGSKTKAIATGGAAALLATLYACSGGVS